MKNKLVSSLGLAKKAGALSSGTETVLDLIKKRKASLVILASDTSENTQKTFKSSCAYYDVPLYVCELSMQEISDGIGRKSPCAVLGIKKHDILNLILSNINSLKNQ